MEKKNCDGCRYLNIVYTSEGDNPCNNCVRHCTGDFYELVIEMNDEDYEWVDKHLFGLFAELDMGELNELLNDDIAQMNIIESFVDDFIDHKRENGDIDFDYTLSDKVREYLEIRFAEYIDFDSQLTNYMFEIYPNIARVICENGRY